MEAAEVQNNDTVHPEVRAHINSLVSALGGFSVDDDDGYKLGDDALEVLRDLKRWIRFYDEKTNRMDVARCLADVNLVGGDLLHILATWKENCIDSRFRARIALACFEIMVPLTWPIEKDKETMTVNHHRHIPVLQLAQLAYKRGIINFDGAHILHTAIRVALPSMALSIGDRTPRDQGIIKLVLYFLRNIAMIAPPQGIKYEGDESQISRSATIDAFSYQDVFLTLLAIASNMGEDFRTEDVVVMEIVFHIVKRVDPGKLFLNEQDLQKAKADELSSALKKEEAMLRSYSKNAPTRHSRFGTMIWVKGQNGKLSTVSGQDALLDAATRERKMDSSKTFRPPRRPRKAEMEPKDLGPPVSLNARASQQLRSFVGDFLDSGFNPLFQHVIKSMNREAPHILQYHRGQFFYLVAWFLEAERLRRRSKKDQKKQKQKTPAGDDNDDDDEVGSFNLVAGVLHQEMFITLNRALEQSYGDKDWSQLAAVMRAYSQILLTVQEMSESGNGEDEEIADNILSRLFYEEATHDAVANIVRTYKEQGFEYLDACTELTHTYLRILEAYSKQNVDLQVRSRKQKRQKKKKAAAAATGEGEDETTVPDDDESADDERHAEKTSQERKFDFKKFANRFIPQGVIDTFVTFTKYYRDLDDAQLKRAHRYFYRVAFKQEMSVMLFRLDIIHLFYNMIKGPEALTKESSMYREWEELAKQIIKKCIRKLEERPTLFTELLFSKINSTAHYLEYGYEKQTLSTANPRPGAELEFKKAVDHDQQIAIVVGVLLDRNQTDHLAWIKTQLAAAESERRAWEAAQKAMLPSVENPDQPAEGEASNPLDATPPHITVRADNDARRTAMFKNPHLRLLMKLVGMERLTPTLDETPDSSWIFPGTLSSDALQNSIDLISKAEFSPPTFEEGQSAEDQLRRKSAARKRVAYDDDNDGVHGMINDDDEDGLEEDFLFAPGGPTARKPDERPKKRQKRLRRRKEGEEEVDDKELEERARARRQKELEKARKIKSEMYVHASDDETDEERDADFFAKENMRQKVKDSTFGLTNKPASQKDKTDWDMLLDVNSDDEEMQEKEKEKGVEKKAKQKKRGRVNAFDSDSEEEEQADSESAESESSTARRKKTQKRRQQRKRRKGKTVDDDETSATAENDDNSGEEEAEDTPLSATPSNQMTTESSEKTMHEITGKENQNPTQTEDQDEDEDDDMPAPTKAGPRERTRARAGFVVDSSDDE
ncbi:timeless-domain-containing protein [Diplogelasinospora grovesii]|uniref:Topoisomerase 1-associated factor 1 n=1 Tax=Diplogelasinospora grovesii TaxID=303347 RepID=A0AAN6S9T4_9PEZI|nr:timeless-domain-containing protein [Diplogelasinospora grovesii]